MGDLRHLIVHLSEKQGIPASGIRFGWEYHFMTVSIHRPPTRQARISPKLAAFFGWKPTA
jgi:hypothetical protein